MTKIQPTVPGRVTLAAVVFAAFVVPVAPQAAAVEADDVPQRCGGVELEWAGENGHRVDATGALTPLVMVHGIDSDRTHWREWIEHTIDPVGSGIDRALFEQFNLIDGVAAYTFDYSSTSLRWIHDASIGPALGAAIDCLHDAFGRPVIVVAHSMGGLATRWAAASTDDAGVARHTKIGTVITFGTPYLGSDLLRVARTSLDAASITGAATGTSALPLLRTLIAACGRAATANPTYCPITGVNVVDSDAGEALYAGSAALTQAAPWPEGLEVHALAGSIEVTQTVGLFFNRHQVTTDIGDIAVSTSSATADATHTRTWSCPYTLDLERSALDRAGVSLGFTSEVERDRYFPVEGWASACFHTRITTTLEITNEALSIVADHITVQEVGRGHAATTAEADTPPRPGCETFHLGFVRDEVTAPDALVLISRDPNPAGSGYARPSVADDVEVVLPHTSGHGPEGLRRLADWGQPEVTLLWICGHPNDVDLVVAAGPNAPAPTYEEESDDPATADTDETSVSWDRFWMPSRNIACQHVQLADDAMLRCDIRSGLEPSPTETCEAGGWFSVVLLDNGPAEPVCAGDSIIYGDFADEGPVLDYGHTWAVGALQCTSHEDGLTCESETGHGFELARSSWAVY